MKYVCRGTQKAQAGRKKKPNGLAEIVSVAGYKAKKPFFKNKE